MMQHITIEYLRQKVGQTWLAFDYTIERELLLRFAEVLGDCSSRWQTEVPPSLLCTIGLSQVSECLTSLPQAVLHGSTEIECFSQVSVGDSLKVVIEVDAVRERPPFTFIKLKIAQHNQNGVPVACCKQLIALRSVV